MQNGFYGLSEDKVYSINEKFKNLVTTPLLCLNESCKLFCLNYDDDAAASDKLF